MPPILGDADQLTQVLLNLGANAVDAMPDGGDLVFQTELRPERDAVVIKVIDTGVGMTAEHAAAHLRAVLHHQAGRAKAPGSGCR